LKTDAIIIGSELDGLVAAMRLLQHGYSIRMFSNGAGSLHYAPAGLHLLGYTPPGNEEIVVEPFDSIARLDRRHPYRKVGVDQVRNALDWFVKNNEEMYQPVAVNGDNELVVSPAGLCVPVYATSKYQATVKKLSGKTVVVVRFRDYRDFPIELIAAGLGKTGTKASIVDIEAPGGIVENAALAKAFDALEEPDSYFAVLKGSVPADTEVILFPAVMGWSRCRQTLTSAERVLGVPCLEVPTLPPSVPGMRLERALSHHLQRSGIAFHTGARINRFSFDKEDRIVVWDEMGRRFEAGVVIVSNGGVLMGGLDVDSYGVVTETTFGFQTFQSEPLRAVTVDQSLNALHVAGVETDNALRPQCNGSGICDNVFVTGRTLAHWNPAVECSTEGVCIATGFVGAENAHTYLGALNDG
jgi:glycerol-3-phosphate dehydrogenase subunit B